jgi:hypothetical protein
MSPDDRKKLVDEITHVDEQILHAQGKMLMNDVSTSDREQLTELLKVLQLQSDELHCKLQASGPSG